MYKNLIIDRAGFFCPGLLISSEMCLLSNFGRQDISFVY